MPYILSDLREMKRTRFSSPPETVGELNYAITTACLAYLKEFGLGYATINDIVGALECAKLEIYRRLAAPHEDKKAAQNGDVFPPQE